MVSRYLIVCIAMIVAALVLIARPTVYWWNHPAMTEMELFQGFWLHYLIAILLMAGSNILLGWNTRRRR